jgi:hypothetical protein
MRFPLSHKKQLMVPPKKRAAIIFCELSEGKNDAHFIQITTVIKYIP